MCMEDIRVMRRTKTATKHVRISDTSTPIAAYAANRVALVFSASDGSQIKWAPTEVALGGLGHWWEAASGAVALDIQRHGALVTSAIYGVDPAGGSVFVTVTEVFLDEE